MAADVLRPVWDESGGEDGFVSLEVEPAIAHDTDRTIEQAREFWQRVDRPNLMVKIPGTDEGVPAIEACLADGININITLLFAVEAYERVMEAYVKAMETRHERGDSLDVGSVASFFVSRVDSEVDKRLDAMDRKDLRGKAAVANARAAYMRFKDVFQGERFAKLREAGCPVQRPLWASTGVKDPAYKETKYVEELVAPRHGQHDADAHAARLRRAARGHRPHRRPGPDGRARGPGRGRHRHEGGHREAPARRDRQVRHAVRRADRRDRAGARGDRHRAPAHDLIVDPRRARAGDRGQGQGGDLGGRGPEDLAPRRVALGRPGRARDRRPPRLAHDQRQDARPRRRPAGVRRGGQVRRASPTRCCSAWAARASARR